MAKWMLTPKTSLEIYFCLHGKTLFKTSFPLMCTHCSSENNVVGNWNRLVTKYTLHRESKIWHIPNTLQHGSIWFHVYLVRVLQTAGCTGVRGTSDQVGATFALLGQQYTWMLLKTGFMEVPTTAFNLPQSYKQGAMYEAKKVRQYLTINKLASFQLQYESFLRKANH